MIPLAKPSLSWRERRNVSKAVKSTWIGSKGFFIDRATEDFKQVCGADYVALVSNGTTALHLALLSLNVGDSDEVIIPNFTYVAVANAVRYCNAKPIFCNVDSKSWNLDPEEIRARVSPRTKAIIVVNSYGRIADYPRIREILSEMHRNDVKIIEDASQSHFGSKNGFVSGTFGDIAIFSFFANKVLTTGEGGAVCSNDKSLIDRVNFLKNQSLKSSNENYFDFPEIGYNYRMNNLAAALLCGQIKRSTKLLNTRNEIYQSYRHELEKYEFYEFQAECKNEFISPWLFPLILKVKDFQTRNLCIDFMKKNGVETRPFYKILSMLPAFQKYNVDPDKSSTKLSALGINLPTYVDLRQKDIKIVCTNLNRFMQNNITTNYVNLSN